MYKETAVFKKARKSSALGNIPCNPLPEENLGLAATLPVTQGDLQEKLTVGVVRPQPPVSTAIPRRARRAEFVQQPEIGRRTYRRQAQRPPSTLQDPLRVTGPWRASFNVEIFYCV